MKVISGGQTGVDQAAIRAARAAGIDSGGTAPRGWRTEAGPAPWLADYGLREHAFASYPARTRVNVRDSDGTLIIEAVQSAGTNATFADCGRESKPALVVNVAWTQSARGGLVWSHSAADVVAWLVEKRVGVLNVAGNRESKAPWIGAASEEFLGDVFRLWKGGATS